jgi:uncharacterized membrane protein YoaK (UPF0700 family)
MKWIDHIIYADYWTRTKVILVLFPFIAGGSLMLHHQKWGLWLMVPSTVLFLVMLIHKRLARQPSETMEARKQEAPPWWVSTEHWDIRIKAAVILLLVAGGIGVKFLLHLRTFRLAIVWPAIFLLAFILQALFPEHPRQRKPKPDESSKLKID